MTEFWVNPKKQEKTKNYERVEAKNVKKSHNCDKCQ